MIRYQAADSFFAHAARTRHARNLQRRIGRGDVGIEPARRARHCIDGNRGVGRQAVALAVFLGQLPDACEVRRAVLQLRIVGAKVGAARRRSIVAVACRRWPGLKVFRPREFLSDEFGTDDDSAARHQAPAGLAREQRPANRDQQQGEDTAGQQRQHQHAQDGRPNLLTELCLRGRREHPGYRTFRRFVGFAHKGGSTRIQYFNTSGNELKKS